VDRKGDDTFILLALNFTQKSVEGGKKEIALHPEIKLMGLSDNP
jgi:hypothetical protein